MNHSEWKTRRTRTLLGETVEESPAYTEAGYAFALGQAVHDRRTALGLSQTDIRFQPPSPTRRPPFRGPLHRRVSARGDVRRHTDVPVPGSS